MVITQPHAVRRSIVPSFNVLIIIPESPIAHGVVMSTFKRRGHSVDLVAAETCLDSHLNQYDLLILELDSGDADAVWLCSRLRQVTLTPLLVLAPVTARSQGIRALELGADGFVLVPFDRRELVARSEALVRRHRHMWFPLHRG